MKRPGVSEKMAVDVDHEPDFYRISEMSPVPEKADDDSILLHCTVKGGPKARMPVYCGGVPTVDAPNNNMPATTAASLQEQAFLASFHKALAVADNKQPQQMDPTTNALFMQNAFATMTPNPFATQPAASPFAGLPIPQQQDAAAAQVAASQFAAGFAAAAALSSNHLRNVLGQALGTSPPYQALQQQPASSQQQQQQQSS